MRSLRPRVLTTVWDDKRHINATVEGLRRDLDDVDGDGCMSCFILRRFTLNSGSTQGSLTNLLLHTPFIVRLKEHVLKLEHEIEEFGPVGPRLRKKKWRQYWRIYLTSVVETASQDKCIAYVPVELIAIPEESTKKKCFTILISTFSSRKIRHMSGMKLNKKSVNRQKVISTDC